MSLQRAARDADPADPFVTDTPDDSNLRSASQQFRQAAGALTIIGYAEVAKVLSAAESATEFFLRTPGACTGESVATISRSCVAVINFLQAKMGGYIGSPVALFPCYREIKKIYASGHCHPADLWPHSWHLHTLAPWRFDTAKAQGLLTNQSGAHFDQALLGCIRNGDSASADLAVRLCSELAGVQKDPGSTSYWYAAAGFFEAIRLNLLALTPEVKRSLADIRNEFLTRHETTVRNLLRQTRELVFFCACASLPEEEKAAWLREVRRVYGLQHAVNLDYTSDFFSRRDPQQLALAARRHEAIAESWNAFVRGQNEQLTQVCTQFSLLRELLVVLEPKAERLLQLMGAYLDELTQTGAAPSAAMAMEIALALLALEAACEVLLPAPKIIERQFAELAQRLLAARTSRRQAPLSDWMAHILRRSMAGSAMTKLTRALHTEFRQIELDLEHYFSSSGEIVSLSDACIRLHQVGGIFKLLDMPQAQRATEHLRAQINAEMMQTSSQTNPRTEAPTSWAANLGSLGVLADMLAYQSALAQKAFHFDAALGELVFKPLPAPSAPDLRVVQARSVASATAQESDSTTALAQAPSTSTPTAAPATHADAVEAVEDEIRVIFLAEARTVIEQARQAIARTAWADGQQAQQQDLHAIRRAFHTLKGGARMVGLRGIGESAWAFEQLMNEHLVQPRNPLADVLTASDTALVGLQEWVDAITAGAPAPHSDSQFRETADALRLHSSPVALQQTDGEGSNPLAPGASESDSTDQAYSLLRRSAPLLRVFAAEASERIARMQHAIDYWYADADAAHRETIRDLAHALRGGASTVGNMGLAELAGALESSLESLAPKTALTAEHRQLLQDCVADLLNLLQRFTEGHHDTAQASLITALQNFGVASPHPALSVPAAAPEHLTTPAPQAPFATPTPPSPPALDMGDAPVSAYGPAHAATSADETENDLLDPELWPIFQEEARELLHALGQALEEWASEPDSDSATGQLRRLLHTLKGSARLAGAMRMGALTHDLESYLAELPQGRATATDIATARDALDAIQTHFDQHGPVAAAEQEPSQQAPATDRPVQHVQASLRIRALELDHLLDQSSEVLLIRARMQSRTDVLLQSLETMAHNASRLREQLRELELQSELQMQSRSSAPHTDASVLDPLELDRFTRLQEIARMMAESHDDLGTVQKSLRDGLADLDRDLAMQNRQSREMHQDILAMRLVAFDDIAGRLYAVVRQAAKHVGVSVRLDISGSTTKLDRGLLYRIAPSLEHLLRNAVVHGIEPVATRMALGKPPSGLIVISVAQTGQEIRMDVRDDGAGLRTDRIRAKAIEQSLLPEDAELREEDAVAMLLRPGFSTSEDITVVAGRGVGMDVVHSEVQALGGQLAVQTESGHGMCFSMAFPLTTALTQIAVFRVGDITFGVPGNMVAQVVEAAPAADSSPADGPGFVDLADHGRVEVFWAGDLLEGPDPGTGQAPQTARTVVFSSAGRTVALRVDQAMGEREMTLKNLGPQLSGLPALLAAGVLPSAELVLIYNPVALATVYGNVARKRSSARAMQAQNGGPERGDLRDAPVLVVDDSITMRRVTERLLVREGMRVVLASDGLDALEKLKTVYPAVILSDIEMPRLDGFDLVRRIRADARTANIPIVIVSSRVAQKHQDIAAELGANHYLGKPFKEAELLALVRLYCGEKSLA
jgi:chemosensory pili system protein ChpA (sensor histidine kinase/response regulator)